MKPMKTKKLKTVGFERYTNYTTWMDYIYKTLHKKPSQNKSKIGNRSLTEIYKEIEELREIDKRISNKVRATYTIKK
tara:strand:+ start:124 stop:354 length:231 start_codon:yes stop_codon:yes gene_type:complete